MSDDKKPVAPAPTGGIVQTIMSGLSSFLGGLGHQPVKKVVVEDPIMSVVKTFLGGMAMSKADTIIEIEMNTNAQNFTAEGDKLAAQLEAEALSEASKIEATGKADAYRILAKRRHAAEEEHKK
jgi:hypothetical protein